jgi:hypothetical protein
MDDQTKPASRVKNAEFTRGRPFAKGNPGRPKGSRNVGTLLAEALLQDNAADLVKEAIEDSKRGHGPAMRWCLDRLVPKRDRILEIDLPEVKTAEDAAEALSRITQLVADGEITPAEARALATLVESHSKTLDVAAMERRLAELENAVQYLRIQVSDLTRSEAMEPAQAAA